MNIKKLLIKLSEFFPEGSLKNKARCYYHNHFVRSNYDMFYKNNSFFQIKFKDGTEFKCYNNIAYSLNIPLRGYLARYKLNRGDVIIDCGAHVGDFALYAAKVVGDIGTVIAFEPDPLNYKKLIANIELNDLTNVLCVNKGVWSINSTLNFTGKYSLVSCISSDIKTDSAVNVPVVSLDSELEERKIKKVDFIKMDVEGSEIKAVKGAEQILKNNDVSLAIASYHIVNGEKTCFELEKLLSKFGYKAKTLFPEHLTTYATKYK